MIETLPKRRMKRSAIATFAALVFGASGLACSADTDGVEPNPQEPTPSLTLPTNGEIIHVSTQDVVRSLGSLAIKGRAPKTGYTRKQFGEGWTRDGQCDTRERILKRDMQDVITDSKCRVIHGVLQDPYTPDQPGDDDLILADETDIDHVVSLSDAWQKGAQQWEPEQRVQFANDGLNLLAVSASANRAKGDKDLATWLPKNREYWCMLDARQILVKYRYHLSVTRAEHDKMAEILSTCPDQQFAISQ